MDRTRARARSHKQPIVGHKSDLSTVFLSDDRSASDQDMFLPIQER